MEKIFEAFVEIRNEIEGQCSWLWEKHNKHMLCRAGCSKCCQSFKVLPIEYHFIQKSLQGKEVIINPGHKKDECKFLVDHKCMIYEDRPIICRTHGYPLARLNEEARAYEISFCDLNFKDYPLENFTKQNVYFEDEYNSRLYSLNKEFIKNYKKNIYDAIELIEVNRLKVGQ